MEKAEKIELLCKMLGVEIGEEFKICGDTYKITDDLDINYDGIWMRTTLSLTNILNWPVEKLPFRPKEGEQFYYPTLGMVDAYGSTRNQNRPLDKLIIRNNLAFRTKEEAIAKAVEMWGE